MYTIVEFHFRKEKFFVLTAVGLRFFEQMSGGAQAAKC
jgi:hypothetical protein